LIVQESKHTRLFYQVTGLAIIQDTMAHEHTDLHYTTYQLRSFIEYLTVNKNQGEDEEPDYVNNTTNENHHDADILIRYRALLTEDIEAKWGRPHAPVTSLYQALLQEEGWIFEMPYGDVYPYSGDKEMVLEFVRFLRHLRQLLLDFVADMEKGDNGTKSVKNIVNKWGQKMFKEKLLDDDCTTGLKYLEYDYGDDGREPNEDVNYLVDLYGELDRMYQAIVHLFGLLHSLAKRWRVLDGDDRKPDLVEEGDSSDFDYETLDVDAETVFYETHRAALVQIGG